jgi:hypothetical protein
MALTTVGQDMEIYDNYALTSITGFNGYWPVAVLIAIYVCRSSP